MDELGGRGIRIQRALLSRGIQLRESPANWQQQHFFHGLLNPIEGALLTPIPCVN